MRVCMIGTGYVGLVSGACFAELGHTVVCVDTNAAKIARLHNGEVPIYEPGLKELIARNHEAGRIVFTTKITDAVDRHCEFYFIAVGTPTKGDDGGADMEQVYQATADAAKAVRDGTETGRRFAVFVTKSTVPVGTSRHIDRIAGEYLEEGEFAVASNPEFLREGSAVEDFMGPDRIIAGSRCERARGLIEELYRPLTRLGRPLVMTTSVETAELIKYAANAFLATKITFINEIGRLCEKVGADVEELAFAMGLDKRIGDKFLKTGPGFGGSCFPKDTLALIKTANDVNSPVEIVETVVRVNNRHKHFMFNKIRDAMGGSVAGKKVAVLGLAFKANTDDVRDSPALAIVPVLRREGAMVEAYDPVAQENAMDLLGTGGIHYHAHLKEALMGADAAVVVTEWDEFRKLDWQNLRRLMKTPLIVDLRNIYSLPQAGAMGIGYVSLGRSPVASTLHSPAR